MSALDLDLEMIQPLNGLHIGLLTIPELEALTRLVHAGLAEREYSGTAALLGLPRVRIVPPLSAVPKPA